MEKTFKNCYAAIFLPTAPEDARELPPGELAARIRAGMRTQLSGEFPRLVCAGMNTMIHLGAKMPGYYLKTKVLAMGDSNPRIPSLWTM